MRPTRILKELELTREQIQQIRRINARQQPIIQAAARNLREANRALDAVIYADFPNEEEILTKIKDVQTAQAELLKARTMTEFMIRKVLTPEQLEKFRQMRLRQMQNNEMKRPLRERRRSQNSQN
jgi:Spy/CpxP family protein refolding chaperone